MDNNQLEEIQTRRQDELEALQAFYGHQLRSALPHLSPPHHDNDGDPDEISLNGPWFIELIDATTTTSRGGTQKYCKIPTLEIRLPPHYPLSSPSTTSSSSRPIPILHHVDNNLLTSLQKQSLIEELIEMYEADMDMAILWAERCRQEFLDVDLATVLMNSAGNASLDTTTASANGGAINQNSNDATTNYITDQQQQQQQQSPSIIQFLQFNHLLYGKQHKKESQIVSLASKLGLLGFIVYGTPGIIGLVVSNDEEDVVLEFAKDCTSRIGKRANVLEFEVQIAPDGGLLSSDRDGAVVDVEGGRVKSAGAGGKHKSSSKKNKKSKSKSNDNKGNGSSSGSSSSTPMLVNLLGDDRVTIINNSVSTIEKKKSGLRHFDSLAELKEVLPGYVVQSILGL